MTGSGSHAADFGTRTRTFDGLSHWCLTDLNLRLPPLCSCSLTSPLDPVYLSSKSLGEKSLFFRLCLAREVHPRRVVPDELSTEVSGAKKSQHWLPKKFFGRLS